MTSMVSSQDPAVVALQRALYFPISEVEEANSAFDLHGLLFTSTVHYLHQLAGCNKDNGVINQVSRGLSLHTRMLVHCCTPTL